MNNKKTIIHWFRKGQRIHDNPALIKAIKTVLEKPDVYVFRPIFILDPAILKWMKVGANRFRFLQQSLVQLDDNLKTLNSRLYVVRGNPKELFPDLFETWKVHLLTFENDIEPYAVERDAVIMKQAAECDVQVIQELSHTIYDPNIILQKNMGKPPLTYQKFLGLAKSCKAGEPLGNPEKIPVQCSPPPDLIEQSNKNCYDPPTLAELLVNEAELGPNKYPGGETESLTRLEQYLKKTKWICEFEKPNTSPNSLEPSTTVLSPYLKFGCLSSRVFYKKLKEVLKNNKHSQPPVSLEGQLMWREFYYCVAVAVPNFDKMVGNTICCQVPWDNNTKNLQAWTYGKTGYPFIDAIMRQLRQEGWIHHLARHAVACFLTRGDLWISWEEGQKVFEELLLDADWALNAGNWMWLSASAFFHQFFRVYSPVAFGKKTDPEGKYIKKYVPELAKYPSGIIYEPWKASLETQKKLGCIIGKDYPQRIVVHEDVVKKNISKMSQAYKNNKETKNSTNSPDAGNKRKASASPASTSRSSKTAKTKSPQKNTLSKYFKKK